MLSLNEEIVLSCAFRYALGRMTYVVPAVCAELKRNYNQLSVNTKKRIAKEIQEYQNEHGEVGMDMDNDEWNKVKWLFDETNRVEVKANKHNTDEWVEVLAIKADDGKYYSIPEMFEYHTIVEIIK